MNATALPTAESMVATMARSLVSGARQGTVDLGSDCSTEVYLRKAGFSPVDLILLGEEAIEQARAALQLVAKGAAAAATPLALVLMIGVWITGYVAVCPPVPTHHHALGVGELVLR